MKHPENKLRNNNESYKDICRHSIVVFLWWLDGKSLTDYSDMGQLLW